jgi:hypothetical protein
MALISLAKLPPVVNRITASAEADASAIQNRGRLISHLHLIMDAVFFKSREEVGFKSVHYTRSISVI